MAEGAFSESYYTGHMVLTPLIHLYASFMFAIAYFRVMVTSSSAGMRNVVEFDDNCAGIHWQLR